MAQENLARSHFEVTWLGETRLEVTSTLLGSRKLGPKSLRGRISMSLQSHFEVTWLEKTRVEVTSKFRSYAKKLFEKTVPVTPNSEALSSAPPRTEDGYPRVHTSIYIYICIYLANGSVRILNFAGPTPPALKKLFCRPKVKEVKMDAAIWIKNQITEANRNPDLFFYRT